MARWRVAVKCGTSCAHALAKGCVQQIGSATPSRRFFARESYNLSVPHTGDLDATLSTDALANISSCREGKAGAPRNR